MASVRIATRGSRLARWQAEHVGRLLRDAHGVEPELVVVSTTGDVQRDVPIHALGGTGVFVKEVQQALLDGRADVAVHSAKDLPSDTPAGLVIACVPERGDPRDAIVGARLDEVRRGGTVGTGSVRRRAQLAALRPDLVFAELRGNIDTRLERVLGPDRHYDAIVMALAALQRLERTDAVAEIMPIDTMVPQIGQGALAIECRADDQTTRAVLAAIDHPASHRCVTAERAFLAAVGGGCDLPVAAHAVIEGERIVLVAEQFDDVGAPARRVRVEGTDPETVGRDAAQERSMTVYLVGAGPGDPGLLTRRGAELLACADVVVHDRLGTASLLPLARDGAHLIDVGKAPGRAAMSQDEINATLVDHGRSGTCVVRLKGGDPFVFGRGGEEAEALRSAGVEFEVVPGITSAIAAPAYAGIPVTHRGLATHVTIVTGHEDPAKGRTDVDWEALARAGGTLVILMGAGHIADIATRLQAGGLPASTPAAAIRWGTTAQHRTIRTTLGAVAGAGIESPSAIVVGAVAGLELAWFERRPLLGRRVVVTRAREQASALRARLEALGADVIELPAIRVEAIPIALPPLEQYQWLVFTSANGVRHLFDRGLAPAGLDARALHGLRVACIGPGTARELSARGITADLVPPRFVAESLLDVFPRAGTPADRVVLARAETARDVLPDGLRALGYHVDVLPVYRTVSTEPSAGDLEVVRSGAVDAVTFTSSSTVEHFVNMIGGTANSPWGREAQPSGGVVDADGVAILSIGPITSDTARAHGLRVDAEADPHDIDGLVAAVVDVLGPTPHR